MAKDSFHFIPVVPLWATTPREYFRDYRQQRDAYLAPTEAAIPVVLQGEEVPLESVVKRTKTGQWNTQSTLGKVVALLEPLGWEVRAGRSEKLAWVGAAHHAKHVYCVDSRITLNGERITLEQLKEAVGE